MKKLLFLLLFISYNTLFAQIDEKWIGARAEHQNWSRVLQEQRISDKKVVIINNNDKTLKYEVSYPESSWSYHDIESKYIDTYDLLSFDRMNIRVTTSGKVPVEYYLSGGERYEIKWNSIRGLWDVYRVSDE